MIGYVSQITIQVTSIMLISIRGIWCYQNTLAVWDPITLVAMEAPSATLQGLILAASRVQQHRALTTRRNSNRRLQRVQIPGSQRPRSQNPESTKLLRANSFEPEFLNDEVSGHLPKLWRSFHLKTVALQLLLGSGHGNTWDVPDKSTS